MSRLEELITELCPDGVEYKQLQEILKIRNGCDYKHLAEGDTPVYGSGGIMAYVDTHIYNKPSVLIPRKGSIDKLYYVDEPFWNVDTIFFTEIDETAALPKYVFHSLKREHLEKYNTAGGVPSLTQAVLKKVKIPVPPLPIQAEIVRILDTFTELTARKKQYEEYLNILIRKTRFSNPSVIKLGELFDFRNGLSKGKEFFGRGTPFIRYTDVYNNRILRKDNISALVECTSSELEKLKVTRGDVLFTRTSETAEDVGWSSVMLEDVGECVFNGFTIRATPKTDRLLPEYCAYCFSTKEFRHYVSTHCAFTTRASLTGATIAEYELAVPSIDEQWAIVGILNKLYLLCNSLSYGLPAEIEARQRQYEYYRDKLLTFRELNA